MKTLDLIKAEFIGGRSRFDWLFLVVGILIQIIVFSLNPQNPIAVVSGIAGIISVILCSQGKISTFLFGVVQITTYLYLCWIERLYAEMAMNVFYFLSQFVGLMVWLKRYQLDTENSNSQLDPKQMKIHWFILCLLSVMVVSCFVGFILSKYTADSQPYLDAFTTVPAIFAQILLILAYREQWIVWLLVDVLSVVMWLRAEQSGNGCIAAQYAFWCLNCLYGYIKWSKNYSANLS